MPACVALRAAAQTERQALATAAVPGEGDGSGERRQRAAFLQELTDKLLRDLDSVLELRTRRAAAVAKLDTAAAAATGS